MTLPEPLFRFINPLVGLLLRSPIHTLLSASVLLLRFTTRRTHRTIALPLRYAATGDGLICFTTDNAKWWKNFEDSRSVTAIVARRPIAGVASASRVQVGASLDELRCFLSRFPSDAHHHGVSVSSAGVPSEADLSQAPLHSIMLNIRVVP